MMLAASRIIVQNLAYVVGAVLLATIGGIVVTLWHHRPTSMEADMESFNRGLDALAPGSRAGGRKKSRPARAVGAAGPVWPTQTIVARPIEETQEAETG